MKICSQKIIVLTKKGYKTWIFSSGKNKEETNRIELSYFLIVSYFRDNSLSRETE